MVWQKDTHAYTWQDLEGKISPEVLCAPKTVGDSSGEYPHIHARIIGYLLRNVVGTPWIDHFALIAAILSARRRDVHTIEEIAKTLHVRFSALFPLLGLRTMAEWNPNIHLQGYFQGEHMPHDSLNTRQQFLKRYAATASLTAHWLETLPEAEQERYRPFILPPVNPFLRETWSRQKEVELQQQERRKAETAAVVPFFTEMRAEAHFRYNRLTRLRQAYQQALTLVLPDHSNLPMDFSYEEGEPPVERLHLRLWDRRTFVLDPEHRYPDGLCEDAKLRRRAYSDERNDLFLELVKVEWIAGDAPPEGLWFSELLTKQVLGNKARSGAEQEVAERQAWLKGWGYVEDNPNGKCAPFETCVSGLLTWGDGGRGGGSMGQYMALAQRRTTGVLIPVESLYAAATFGLLALELLTTTGMRINELMQVNLLPECVVRIVDAPPPGARDQSPRIRYVLRLLPKGERTEQRHHYGIGAEALRLIERTAQMLCEHYQLQPGESLPRVLFDPTHSRSHRFEEEKVPYLFQYSKRHLSDNAISVCLRFLIHGMAFQTSHGTPVIIKSHLIRHAFATFAAQIEGIPIDLVGYWLKQKNLDVTRYYAQETEQRAAEKHGDFVERLASEIHIREAILRSPEEIRKQAEAARLRVGTLVDVSGGDCTFDGLCHNQFDCIHCPSKAPDPEKRYQVEEKKHNAEGRLAYYEQEGLVLEAEKMRRVIRNCDLELREMDMIVACRKDGERATIIQIQPRKQRP